MQKFGLLMCSGVLGTVLVFCGCMTEQKAQKVEAVRDTVSVHVMEVGPEPFTEFGTYYGRILPINEAQIICYAGGRVDELKAKEGSWVKQGTSLAGIDAAKATSLLETARLQEKIAKQNLEQTRKHFQDGNASQLAVDQANLAYLGAQSTRIDAEKNHRGALVVSPIDGVVTTRFISLYQELPPGSPTFTVAQTSTMKVRIGIAESDAILVGTGAKVKVSVEMFPERVWQGTIKTISGESAQDSKVFWAEVYIDNRDGALKPGVSGRVQIAIRKLAKSLVVPTSAIKTEGVRSSVLIVDTENIAHRRFIELGPQSDTSYVVRGGLSEGEKVIVSGQHLVADGVPVKVVN